MADDGMTVEERAAAGISGAFELEFLPCDVAVSVSFKDGARTWWHTHPGVQTLICVAGRGRVQYADGQGFDLAPGAMIAIPAEVKHWHGALPGNDMTHVALNPGAPSTLIEPVTD